MLSTFEAALVQVAEGELTRFGGQDAVGRFARTIGGNESDTVGTSRLALNDAGIIRQRSRRPFIAVIQTLK
jgi:hypothetical protein